MFTLTESGPPSGEQLAFDVARYQQVVGLGNIAKHATYAPGEMPPSEALRALQVDPDARELLRASLQTEHADNTIAALDNWLDDNRPDELRDFCKDVVLHNGAAALTAFADRRKYLQGWGSAVDLLARAYCGSGAIRQGATPQLRRLLPDRVLQLSEEYAARGADPDPEVVKTQAHRLSVLTYGSAHQEPRAKLAREMLSINRTQGEGSLVDQVMKRLLHRSFMRNDLITALGLDRQDLEQHWDQGYKQSLLPDNKTPDPKSITAEEYIARCEERMLDVERRRPGGIRQLRRHNKLRNFGRLSEAMLIDQIDAHQNQYERVFAVGMASYCGNGALMDTMAEIDRARNVLPRGIGFLLVEVDSADELRSRLVTLERIAKGTGRPIKIAAGFLVAHSGVDADGNAAATLSSDVSKIAASKEILNGDDIEGPIGRLLLRLSEPDAPYHLSACAGAQGTNSIVERLHRYTGLPTSGSPKVAGVYGINVTESPVNGALNLDVQHGTRRAEGGRWVFDQYVATRHFPEP